MRRHSPPAPSLPRTIQWLVWATAAFLAGATPYPKDSLDSLDDTGKSLFVPRNCASYCGADNQFCCEPDQACTTLPGNIATCLAATWAPAYTTTWTVTYTSIIMTHWIPAPLPTPGVDCIPQAPEQEACGRICCAGWQQCAYKANGGQCSPRPGYAEPTAVVITSDGQVTTRYAAPFRVIGTTVIVNSGAHPTFPTPTNTAATASGPANPSSTSDGTTIGADGANKGGTGGGLSPGAIAGIVIGTLAAVGLLMLLCFCCIARGVWNTLCGGHRHKDEKVIAEEERYSHHGSRGASSVHARRDRHAGWFGGGGGGRPASVADRRRSRAPKDSDGKWWLGLAGAATAALALLNFKKKEKPSRKPPSSAYHSDSYIYSDVTDQTASSASSGGRTHRTAQTGRSYHSRGGRSHHSHAPSRAPSRRP